MIKSCIYVIGLVFGVFAGLITAAFSFIRSWNLPVYLVCVALVEVFWLLCLCDLSLAN